MYWFFLVTTRYKYHFIFAGFLLSTVYSSLFAQNPRFKFLSDSVQVGQHVDAVFYYTHSPDQEVLFPDSNFNYSPFEFVSKKYFPTVTSNAKSLDSAVYTFSLFEIEGIHALTIPVFILKGKDTLKVFSNIDSLSVYPMIKVVSDTLKLQSNTQNLALDIHFNFAMLGVVVGVFLLIALVAIWIFGKKIMAQVSRYRQKRAHVRFLKQYDTIVQNIVSPSEMEAAVSLWKKYIQKLEGKPFTTFTSAEIGRNLKNDKVKINLRNIDVAMYSGRVSELPSQDFLALRELAVILYQKNQSTKG